MHFLISPDEISAALGVLGFVSRRDDLLTVRSQDFEHRFFVVALRGIDERCARVLRRWKCLLARLLRYGEREDTPPKE